MESYIKDNKKLYSSIKGFLESSNEVKEKSFEKLIDIFQSQKIKGDRREMQEFLEIIKSIGENHHRDQYFNERMNQIILFFKEEIKQTLSNDEIFHMFKNNKKIILFLFKNGIIEMTELIYRELINLIEVNGTHYWHFFIPEIEQFMGKEKMSLAKNELLNSNPYFFDNYEEKRQEGENDSYICSLIRQDSVEEFIAYLNRYNISRSSRIAPSLFETNEFLIKNEETTLIEYSAFFGSIQIFRYLIMNKVELKPSLWLYTIHSKNAEMIHLIEENEIPPPKNEKSNNNYVQCFIESIKCHHNDIADYIKNIFIFQNETEKEVKEEIISNCIKYHNYAYFQIDTIINHGFFYLNFYHYDKLFELLLKMKENEIEKKIIAYSNI